MAVVQIITRELDGTETVTDVEVPDVEVPDVEVPDVPVDLDAVLAGMAAALDPLTPTSTSTQQRAALLNLRGVIDAALDEGARREPG